MKAAQLRKATEEFVEDQLDASRYEVRPTAVLAWTVTALLWLSAPPLLSLLWGMAWAR